MPSTFETTFPNITRFVNDIGWIEVGYDNDSPLTSFVKAIEPGGMVWEGEDSYASMEAAFEALEAGLGEWIRENWGE